MTIDDSLERILRRQAIDKGYREAKGATPARVSDYLRLNCFVFSLSPRESLRR